MITASLQREDYLVLFRRRSLPIRPAAMPIKAAETPIAAALTPTQSLKSKQWNFERRSNHDALPFHSRWRRSDPLRSRSIPAPFPIAPLYIRSVRIASASFRSSNSTRQHLSQSLRSKMAPETMAVFDDTGDRQANRALFIRIGT